MHNLFLNLGFHLVDPPCLLIAIALNIPVSLYESLNCGLITKLLL